MTRHYALLMAGVLALAGCNKQDSSQAKAIVDSAANHAEALENQADSMKADAKDAASAITSSMENQAEQLENAADLVREKAEKKADAVDKALRKDD